MELGPFTEEIKKRRDLQELVHHEELPAQTASYGETSTPLSVEVKKALEAMSIERLYSHQAQGIDLIRQGLNTVIMTPTASGKSLIYNIPVIESIIDDPNSHALYLFPLKGLEQDQLKAFNDLADRVLPPAEREKARKSRSGPLRACEIYDGDTTAYRRKKIRDTPPAVVLTNPDMLHLAINAFHPKWEAFFKGLKYVIIDEVHTYRGVFGSHVAHVLRRLRRIANHYGADPVFIACSATIANPTELASMLTGLDFELVDSSGAPRGKRDVLFINPLPEVSAYTIATRLFISAVKAGLKTIAFTKARKITELMHARVKEGAKDISQLISSYRAGFLPEERREIERRLFSGEMRGVITTSALELGVDIGGLDVCILVGYPGTISSTWQRSGRAGRSGRDSLIILVAMPDALDQYFMRNPSDFFRRGAEAAVLDHENETILKKHILCAASEVNLKPTDIIYDTTRYRATLNDLEAEGKLRHWVKGSIWYPRVKFPHLDVSIREAGTPYTIVNDYGKAIGESSGGRVFLELHPGAVYLHKGMQYKVTKLDMGEKKVWCRPADDINYYTRAITDEATEIVSTEAAISINGTEIHFGKIRVTERIIGYRKKELRTEKNLGEFSLELPPSVFTTTGIWMKVDDGLIGEIKTKGFSVTGALHALEHSMIAALPLFAMCDRMDLGGVSYQFNPELEGPAIFIYDGHEGGVGLAKRGFACIKEWLDATLRLMEQCACEVACPSCTQDPKCGNNNEPLDKRGAIMIIEKWLG